MRWPLNNVRITNGYDPVSHTGNDLAAPTGTPIYAPEAGKVTGVNAGWKPGGYFGGNYIVIQGNYRHYMGHMSSVNTFLNAQVSEGQVIGFVGQTGQATGPHVHYEIASGGQTLDPSKVLNKSQGGDEVLEDNDSEYQRWDLLHRQSRGENLPRAEYKKWVGKPIRSFVDAVIFNPQAMARLRAGDVGKLAIEGDWWNRLVKATSTPSTGPSKEVVDTLIKETKEAYEAAQKLEK